MAEIVEVGAFSQFEPVYERIKQLLKEANLAREKGEPITAQELLVRAWKLTIQDIETRRS